VTPSTVRRADGTLKPGKGQPGYPHNPAVADLHQWRKVIRDCIAAEDFEAPKKFRAVMDFFWNVMSDGGEDMHHRLTAARELRDTIFGKPTQHVEVDTNSQVTVDHRVLVASLKTSLGIQTVGKKRPKITKGRKAAKSSPALPAPADTEAPSAGSTAGSDGRFDAVPAPVAGRPVAAKDSREG
jgi:hypothetical protein